MQGKLKIDKDHLVINTSIRGTAIEAGEKLAKWVKEYQKLNPKDRNFLSLTEWCYKKLYNKKS